MRRRAERGRRGQGEVVDDRAAEAGGRLVPAAVRRLRLHERVPDRRAFLDTRVQTIYGGTTEVMKEIIARDLESRPLEPDDSRQGERAPRSLRLAGGARSESEVMSHSSTWRASLDSSGVRSLDIAVARRTLASSCRAPAACLHVDAFGHLSRLQCLEVVEGDARIVEQSSRTRRCCRRQRRPVVLDSSGAGLEIVEILTADRRTARLSRREVEVVDVALVSLTVSQ